MGALYGILRCRGQMKNIIPYAASILLLSSPGLALACSGNAVPGISLLADDPAQDRPLSLSIWYPSEGGTSVEIGGNAVFSGTEAALEAPAVCGPLPLILLSHGGLRSAADSGAWLAAAMAKKQFLVVEINARAPSTAQEATSEIWRRRRDISRALDMILSDTVWAGHVDQQRISVVGFALGGTAALTVAGIEFDAMKYLGACIGPDAEGPDCGWYARQGVALGSVDRARLSQPGRDGRIASAVAIAPEYPSAFHREENAAAAVLVIALGQQSGLEALPVRHALVPEAQTFDAFASCTDVGSKILLDEGEDPALCGEGLNVRADIHEQIADIIGEFLAD